MLYLYEYCCLFGLGGEVGVDVLMYFFENFIEDVESGVIKLVVVIFEVI